MIHHAECGCRMGAGVTMLTPTIETRLDSTTGFMRRHMLRSRKRFIGSKSKYNFWKSLCDVQCDKSASR